MKEPCKYLIKFSESDINIADVSTYRTIYECDECNNKTDFRYMYNVKCCNTCSLYWKFVCKNCFDKINMKDKK